MKFGHPDLSIIFMFVYLINLGNMFLNKSYKANFGNIERISEKEGNVG